MIAARMAIYIHGLSCSCSSCTRCKLLQMFLIVPITATYEKPKFQIVFLKRRQNCFTFCLISRIPELCTVITKLFNFCAEFIPTSAESPVCRKDR
jgi:hypothetical protein